MLEKDVEDLVRKVQSFNTELNYVEVKEAHIDCPKKLYDTISAFSNLNGGGILLFGLREAESFAAVGVYDAADLQKKVTEQCKHNAAGCQSAFYMLQNRRENGCFGRNTGNRYC